MAKFDIPATNDPFYLTSRPPDAPPVDKTLGTLFANIGNLVDQGVSGLDELYKIKAERQGYEAGEQAFKRYEMTPDEAREMVLGRPKKGPGGTGAVGGEADIDLDQAGQAEAGTTVFGSSRTLPSLEPEFIGGVKQQTGDTAPAGLKAELNNLSRIGAGWRAGEIDPLYFAVEANSKLKELKTRFPGYKEFIDRGFERATGISPANLQIRQTWSYFQALASQANSDANKRAIFLQNHDVMGVMARLNQLDLWQKAFEDPVAFRQVQLMYAQNGPGIKASDDFIKRQLDIAKNAGELQKPALIGAVYAQLTSVTSSWNAEIVRDGKGTSFTDYLNKLQTFLDKGAQIPEVEQQYLGQKIAKIMANNEVSWNRFITIPRPEFDGQSIQQYFALSPNVIETMKQTWDQHINQFVNRVNNKEYGLLSNDLRHAELDKNIKSRQIDSIVKGTGWDIYTQLKKYSPEAADALWRLEIGKDAKGNAINFGMKLTDEMKTIGGRIHGQIALGQIKTPEQAQTVMNAIRGNKADPPGAVHPLIIQGWKAVIADPKMPTEWKLNFLRYATSKEMVGMIGGLGKPDDHYRMLQSITDKATVDAIEDLGEEQKQAYRSFVQQTFITGLSGTTMANTREHLINFPSRIYFDITQGQFAITGPYIPKGQAGPFQLRIPELPVNVKNDLNRLNIGLASLKAANPHLSPEQFFQYAKILLDQQGVFRPSDPDLWETFKERWKSWFTEQMPAEFKKGATQFSPELGEGAVPPSVRQELDAVIKPSEKAGKPVPFVPPKEQRSEVQTPPEPQAPPKPVELAPEVKQAGITPKLTAWNPDENRWMPNQARVGPEWGDPRSPTFVKDRLVEIKTSKGLTVKVNKEAADAFKGFLTDLEATGYNIRTIGGYRLSMQPSGKRVSQHAFGNALDINAGDNPYGPRLKTDMPPNIRELANKWGLSWGGGWRSIKDAMHFEYVGNEPGMGKRSDITPFEFGPRGEIKVAGPRETEALIEGTKFRVRRSTIPKYDPSPDSLNLQENFIIRYFYDHHVDDAGKAFPMAIVVHDDGTASIIPRAFSGSYTPAVEAIAEAGNIGWDKWPRFRSARDAQTYMIGLHDRLQRATYGAPAPVKRPIDARPPKPKPVPGTENIG